MFPKIAQIIGAINKYNSAVPKALCFLSSGSNFLKKNAESKNITPNPESRTKSASPSIPEQLILQEIIANAPVIMNTMAKIRT